ncbi:MAG: hypothetical protein EP305_04740 [Bacteroidetes bacterium]|nr:MAG: hypothetical protein EP305_04740 [Bacteroidota bacterium]
MNSLVDEHIRNSKKWSKELFLLQEILLECGLSEEFKWRQPCYLYGTANVCILGSFKEFCSLAFFKGALLNDAEQLMVSPGVNTVSVKMFKFRSSDEINKLRDLIKTTVFEAIEIEKAGLKVEKDQNNKPSIPEELSAKMEKDPVLKSAFESLTPGRQRAYLMFFEEAKQSKTKEARIEKYIPRILKGKGMNDCICGHSKRMPNCDGSHKYFNQ